MQSELPLTSVQRETLVTLDKKIAANGYPPTESELSYALSVCSQNIHQRISVLQEKGYINRRPYAARALVITDKGRDFLEGIN
jgi:SOS-response transcriptional repressor LexA